MATYPYTGKLTDFGEAPFPNAYPRLVVAPQRDAFSPTGVAAAKKIVVPVGADGSFTVNLIASVDLNPPTRYTLRCEWLAATADGQDTPVGWADWEFTAAIGGGPINTMPDQHITRVWYSNSPPPVERPGIYWVHPLTGDVREWSN